MRPTNRTYGRSGSRPIRVQGVRAVVGPVEARCRCRCGRRGRGPGRAPGSSRGCPRACRRRRRSRRRRPRSRCARPSWTGRSRRRAARPSRGAAAPASARSSRAGCRTAAWRGGRRGWRTRCGSGRVRGLRGRRPSRGRRRRCAARRWRRRAPARAGGARTPLGRALAPAVHLQVGRARRNSRARNSTWTPAPPYTSGGYSRVSSPTFTTPPSSARPGSPRGSLGSAHGHHRESRVRAADRATELRRSVEAAVAAEPPPGAPVVETAAAAPEGVAGSVPVPARIGVGEEFAGECTRPLGGVRPAVRARPAVQLPDGSGERGARVAPQQAGRDPVVARAGPRRAARGGRTGRSRDASAAVAGTGADPASHRSSGALASRVPVQQPGVEVGQLPYSAAQPSATDHSRAASPCCATEARDPRSGAREHAAATVSTRAVSGALVDLAYEPCA